ncbi:MAG: hypothetical protein ACE5DW_00775 [Thermodesulfobacteriota bacterium]
MTPVLGDLIESTVGKVVGKLTDHYLPATMDEKEKAEFRIKAGSLALEEARAATADIENARALAVTESEGAPPWANVLKVTHRPLWSFIMLAIFSWTILAPYLGYPQIPLTEVHKSIMQTVIIFYFGGRSVEKSIGMIKAR